jgi:DNA-binding FadR family transcriptional regulator
MNASNNVFPSLMGQPATKLHGMIAHDLGVAIVSGRYSPGDALTGETKVSSELNVSRGAYREAIRILAAKGLVQSRTKSGTRVCERRNWNMLDLDVLAWIFEAEPSEAFVKDIFELRMIVEPAAAALAAERRTARDLARMGHALEEMERLGLQDEGGRTADQAFHNLILEASRNEPLMTLSSSIAAAVGWTTIFSRRGRAALRDPMPDHRLLFDAMLHSDKLGARDAMIQLIGNALRDTGLQR